MHQPAMPNDPKCDPLNLLHLATEAFDMKDISVNFASMSPSTDFGRVLQPGTNNSVPNRELGLATMSASIPHVGVDTGQDTFIDGIPSGFTPNNIEGGEPTDHQSSLQEEPLKSGAILDPLFDSVDPLFLAGLFDNEPMDRNELEPVLDPSIFGTHPALKSEEVPDGDALFLSGFMDHIQNS